MQDELKRRSVEIDKQGYLPQDLACQLSALGFYRLIVPESLGDLVLPETFCKICEHLGSANGSAVWCVFIGTTSQYLLGLAERSTRKAVGGPGHYNEWVLQTAGRH